MLRSTMRTPNLDGLARDGMRSYELLFRQSGLFAFARSAVDGTVSDARQRASCAVPR